MVLIYISLMPNDVEHLFICHFLSAYHWWDVPSCLGLCSNWIFFFLLLSFENSLHILDISPLSDMCFTNMFSLCIAYLFILPTGSFAEKKFWILIKYIVSVFPFIDCAFDVKSKNSLSLALNLKDFLLFFFQKFCSFTFYI